jgi:heme-degrading monooxygenase HmoA
MQLVYFTATVRDPSLLDTHRGMVAEMRALAESIPGFVEWRECQDDLTLWGHIVFETGDAVLAWKGDPRHGAIHQRGEESVYSSFSTQVFEIVRQANWAGGEQVPSAG